MKNGVGIDYAPVLTSIGMFIPIYPALMGIVTEWKRDVHWEMDGVYLGPEEDYWPEEEIE